MEIVQENLNQYVLSIPIAFIVLVIVGAILVFTFGFKNAEQPPFDKLTNEDRKLAGKKRKYKEKKSPVSGTVTSGELKNEKDSKKSPGKDPREDKQENRERKPDIKQPEKNKKNEVIKQKTNEDMRNKKNTKKVSEKPLDFDDGNWETVPTKNDKKKRGDHSPDKKDKKLKKNEKEPEKIVENVANEESNKIEIKIDETVAEPTEVDVEINIVEENLEKVNKREKKAKKETYEKPLEQTETERILVNLPDPSPVETIPEISQVESISNSNETAAVFDELGDVWTETKVTKKTSKKKARRDN